MGYQDEVIDLTSPEWDEAGEELINDEPNEHVHGAQETLEKDMDVYIAANNAADTNDTLDESARVQVDKTENLKAPRKARKDKLVALAEKRKTKQGEKGTGKRVAVKRKKAVLCKKGNKKRAVVENRNIRDNKAADELDDSTDDDFVTNVGARHGPGMVWSSDMLNKLEADVFPKDDGGDTDVGEEAKLEVSDEEQILEEDDVEEDYYGVGVPTDLEGRKKYVSALLKKAGELVEMADEVLDEGLENNPMDSGFIELKELRNQLFEVPTYSQQPRNSTDEKEEDDPTNFSFHTPDDGGKQYPITQVYGSPTGYRELQDKVWEEWHRQAGHILTRLNFDEVDDIDLNVTQPPATQGKVVGGAEDENNMEEDESLLDALINYVSQETKDEDGFFTPDQTVGVRKNESKMSRFGTDSNAMLDSKAMVPAFSQPKPLNVLLGNIPYGRPRRNVVIPEVLHSPYVVREVSLICGISPHEKRAANCWEYEKASKKFNENMEDVLNNSLYKTLEGVDLVSVLSDPYREAFHPNLHECEKCVVQLFDNILSNVTSVRERYGPLPLVMGTMFLDYMLHVNHPKHEIMRKADFMMMTIGCNTKNNFVDCRVFVMQHMETFKGDVDCCGFSREGEEQIKAWLLRSRS
ncbi:hypothetical protein Tco_0382411 [Tanacetum coccineum]